MSKVALKIAPSAVPAVEPARVVTTPACVTLRRRSLSRSATTRSPLASKAIPLGEENDAAAPVPSARPGVPEPARVVTAPAAVILRIELLSVTKALPKESIAIADRSLNPAVAAGPSVSVPFVAGSVPTIVVTSPAGVTCRMLLLP